MFRRETVFVVGAGASADFDLPVGAELSRRIAGLSKIDIDSWGSPTSTLGSLVLDILRKKTDDVRQLSAWLAALNKISSGIHLKRSIDSFIDQHSSHPEIGQMGKLMIALRIVEAEGRAESLQVNSRGRLDLRNPILVDSWVDQFASMLFDGLKADAISELGKNIVIICFNYDRCIEHYLAHALISTYSLGASEAFSLVEGLNIIHPYGTLGSLETVPFGTRDADYWSISDNLKTFSESAGTDIDEKIRAAIIAAEQMVFLGFSFGQQNMDLMTAVELNPGNEGKPAFASGFGLYNQQVVQVTRQIERLYGHPLDYYSPADLSTFTSIEVNVKARPLLDMHWHNIMAG